MKDSVRLHRGQCSVANEEEGLPRREVRHNVDRCSCMAGYYSDI